MGREAREDRRGEAVWYRSHPNSRHTRQSANRQEPVKPAVPESIKWVKIQLTSGVNILGTESSKLLAQMENVLKTLTDEAFINFARSCGYEL